MTLHHRTSWWCDSACCRAAIFQTSPVSWVIFVNASAAVTKLVHDFGCNHLLNA